MTMSTQRRIYLDNAATSFPKPACVHDAMLHYATQIGASPGRGAYAEAQEGGRILAQCRERLCRLFNGESPDHIIFTLNASDALNLAIQGIITHQLCKNPASTPHVITTAMDHNSVLRPLNAAIQRGITWTCVPCDPITGLVDPDDVANAITRDTRLVAVVHASNVTGTVQPIAKVGHICSLAGVPLLVDASQSLGHLPVDVQSMNIDLLAFPGHKGLLGPLGTGSLYIKPGWEHRLEPIRQGGTGTISESDHHPTSMPERYEPGSHNTIGIAGLNAALGSLLESGIDTIWANEQSLIDLMLEQLVPAQEQGLTLLGPPTSRDRLGVFSFIHSDIVPAEFANLLEKRFGVLSRAGLHCAPRAHQILGTLNPDKPKENSGATRLSLGHFTTPQDIKDACAAILSIIQTQAAPVGSH